MNAINKFIPHIIFRLALMFVFVGVAVFGAFFLKEKIDTVVESIHSQRVIAYNLEKRGENLITLKKQFELVQNSEEKIKVAYPPVDDVLGFVAALESLAQRHSLEQVLNFSAPNSEGMVDYSINLSGNITTLIEYLANFEKLPYFTKIQNVNFQAQSGNWTGDCNIVLTARLFTGDSLN